MRRIHFIHIGKTGGSAIKAALRPIAEDHGIVLHRHSTRLHDIPEGDGFFFVVREPLSRFVSGFYSRQRKGQPRILKPWSEAETLAFTMFTTANDLAEALSDAEPARAVAARAAMAGITHVSSSLGDWIGSVAALDRRRADLILIGFQDRLAQDFETLKHRLRLPPDTRLPDDDVAAHRNPPHVDRTLSRRATENLRLWYAADIALFDRLRQDFADAP